MLRRSMIYQDQRPARIEPPKFPPRRMTVNQHDKHQFTEHSTYSEIVAICDAPDFPAGDSVEEYDDWISAQKIKKVNIPDDILSVTPSTASLIKKYHKKAKKAAKVDKFKLFLEGRDGSSPFISTTSLEVRALMIDPLQPYYQRPIRLVDTRLSMKPDKRKKKEERGPRKIRDLIEGKYACMGVVEVEPIEEVKVDTNDAL